MLEDGNKVYSEQHGTIQSEARSGGSQKGVYHGVTKFVGGTGKFANLRGVLTDELEYDTDPKTGYYRPVSRGEYWFGN